MFRRLFASCILLALGAAAMFAAFSYHLVRCDEGFLFVPRHTPGLDRVYVDIRDWQVGDWVENRDLAQALIDHGRTDLVKPLNPGQLLDDLLRGLGQRPRTVEPSHRH